MRGPKKAGSKGRAQKSKRGWSRGKKGTNNLPKRKNKERNNG